MTQAPPVSPWSKQRILTIVLAVIVGSLVASTISWYLRQPRWELFEFKEQGFRVEFPRAPKHTTDKATIPNTDQTVQYDTFITQHNRREYLVSASVIPDFSDVSNPQGNLDGAVQGMLGTRPGAELVTATPITVQQYPGRAVHIRSDGTEIRGHLVLANRTLYQFLVNSRTNDWDKKSYDRFIQSFVITK